MIIQEKIRLAYRYKTEETVPANRTVSLFDWIRCLIKIHNEHPAVSARDYPKA